MHPQLCTLLASQYVLAEQVYHYKGDAKRILVSLHTVLLSLLLSEPDLKLARTISSTF
jgi:hypothetical protein